MVPVVVRLEKPGVCGCGAVVAAGERAGTTSQPGRVVCLACLAGLSAGPEDEDLERELPGPVAVLIPADWGPSPAPAATATAPPTLVAVSAEAAAMTVPSHRRRTLLPAGLLALHPSRGREPGSTSHTDAATRALLDGAADSGVLSLHDRRMPGRRGRIAHLVLGPAGVYVVDVVRVKNASVEVRAVQEIEPETRELVVDGRTMTAPVTATQGRVAVVRGLLDEVGLSTVPAVGVICFVDTTVSAEPVLDVDAVHVVSRTGLATLVRTTGALDPEHLETLLEYLTERLPA